GGSAEYAGSYLTRSITSSPSSTSSVTRASPAFFFSSRRRHTSSYGDWSSDVCSSDLLALLERAEATGLGVTSFVSIGNKADVSSNDLLEWWEDDDETEMVVLYLESFGNPRAFSRIARR